MNNKMLLVAALGLGLLGGCAKKAAEPEAATEAAGAEAAAAPAEGETAAETTAEGEVPAAEGEATP